jgi:hypothetical protein
MVATECPLNNYEKSWRTAVETGNRLRIELTTSPKTSYLSWTVYKQKH